jgi:gas vesicle protein
MNSGKIVLSVLAGVSVGILLGILFAPDNGWNTRKRIEKKLEDYSDAVEDKFAEFMSDANDLDESDLLADENLVS